MSYTFNGKCIGFYRSDQFSKGDYIENSEFQCSYTPET